MLDLDATNLQPGSGKTHGVSPEADAKARAGHAESIEYDVTGINTSTGERVTGTMSDIAHNGTVHGLILDRLDRVPVAGTWSGKGLARMHGEGQTYKVEVVE